MSLKDRIKASWIGKFFTYLYVRLLFWTYRIDVTDMVETETPFYKREGVYYIWHEHVLGGLFFLHKMHVRGHLVSDMSAEGQIAGYISTKLGFHAMYGQTKPSFIRQALEVIEMNKRIYMVGDGGVGPAETLQKEIPYLCAKTRVPLIFVECTASSSFSFYKRWDNFRIPLPFSKIHITLHKPQYYAFDEQNKAVQVDQLPDIIETSDPVQSVQPVDASDVLD